MTCCKEGLRQLVTMVPEWRDGKTARAEIRAVRGYLLRHGFPAKEVIRLTDPHALAIARKAMLHDERKAKDSDHGDLAVMKAKLKRTGRVEDAAAVIERMLVRQ